MNGQGEGGVGHNEPKPPGFHEVKWIAKTLFTYVNPLLRAAARQQVDSEEHVDWMPPPSDSAQQLSHEFEQEYQSLKVCTLYICWLVAQGGIRRRNSLDGHSRWCWAANPAIAHLWAQEGYLRCCFYSSLGVCNCRHAQSKQANSHA